MFTVSYSTGLFVCLFVCIQDPTVQVCLFVCLYTGSYSTGLFVCIQGSYSTGLFVCLYTGSYSTGLFVCIQGSYSTGLFVCVQGYHVCLPGHCISTNQTHKTATRSHYIIAFCKHMAVVIQSFISPTNAKLICFKILKYTINAPTRFGLTKPSSGSLQSACGHTTEQFNNEVY